VLILHDTRPCAAAFQHRLTGLDRRIYRFCDPGRPLKTIVEFAAQGDSGSRMDEASVRRLLDGWLAARLMVFLDGRYLSLALRAPSDPAA
jgi:hypothetical protein